MHVLFVSTYFLPSHNYKSNGLFGRLQMFVEALKDEELDMLFYVSPETDLSLAAVKEYEVTLQHLWHPRLRLFLCPQAAPDHSPGWQHLARGMRSFFEQPEMRPASGAEQLRAFEACLERQPNVIFIHRLLSMVPAMRTRKPLPPIFLDLDDIEHRKLIRFIPQPPRSKSSALHYLRVPALWWGECQAIRRAQATFVCSESDQAYLTNQWQLPGVVTIPNAVSIPSQQPIPSEPTLLFIGTYAYPPNVNAANFLIEQVFPRIQKQCHDAHLIIAGPNPQNIRGYGRAIPGIEFTGYVDDLEDLYRRVRVVCCPVFAGGGTRVKLIEAAAYGKPIVASAIGAEGLHLHHGKEFLLCNSAQQFAEACLELFSNDNLCRSLGTAARETAIQRYDRLNIMNQIRQAIDHQKINVDSDDDEIICQING
jgi:glycosyltransferase involved in cell wall biosynthesis